MDAARARAAKPAAGFHASAVPPCVAPVATQAPLRLLGGLFKALVGIGRAFLEMFQSLRLRAKLRQCRKEPKEQIPTRPAAPGPRGDPQLSDTKGK